MRQKLTTLLVSLLVIGSVAAVPLTGAAQVTGENTATSVSATAVNNTTNETNASIAPGERLSGVIGVQDAELEGELETRTFGLKVAKAASADAKAEVVAKQLNQSQKRLETLESRLAELREARNNSSMSQGEYAAQVAETRAKLNNVQKMANKTLNASQGIPNETLEANGVNVTAIKTLKQRAAELSGPEVAAIAQTIAGPDAGRDRGNQTARPDNRTADGNQTAGNQTYDGNQTRTPSDTQSGDSGNTTNTSDSDRATPTRSETQDGSGSGR